MLFVLQSLLLFTHYRSDTIKIIDCIARILVIFLLLQLHFVQCLVWRTAPRLWKYYCHCYWHFCCYCCCTFVTTLAVTITVTIFITVTLLTHTPSPSPLLSRIYGCELHLPAHLLTLQWGVSHSCCIRPLHRPLSHLLHPCTGSWDRWHQLLGPRTLKFHSASIHWVESQSWFNGQEISMVTRLDKQAHEYRK